jgi:hypothetical protein
MPNTDKLCVICLPVARTFTGKPPQNGRGQRVISWLADELVALGHDVVLFTSGDSQTSANLEACWPVPVGPHHSSWPAAFPCPTSVTWDNLWEGWTGRPNCKPEQRSKADAPSASLLPGANLRSLDSHEEIVDMRVRERSGGVVIDRSD